MPLLYSTLGLLSEEYLVTSYLILFLGVLTSP